MQAAALEMAVFHLLSEEQSRAWVEAFPQLARTGLTTGLTALGEKLSFSIVLASEKLSDSIIIAAIYLASGIVLGLVLAALVLGGTYVYVASGAGAAV